jgi:hypothetical protein
VSGPSIIRSAHGTAAAGGAILVAEAPPLDELPANAYATAEGLRVRAARGRPFQRGNSAAKGRGPSLTRSGVDPSVGDAARRSVARKAESLRRVCVREIAVAAGGDVSSAVRVEIAAWALATAWSRHAYDQGDARGGSQLAERASAHMLRATGLADRESRARPASPADAPWLVAVDDGEEGAA